MGLTQATLKTIGVILTTVKALIKYTWIDMYKIANFYPSSQNSCLKSHFLTSYLYKHLT